MRGTDGQARRALVNELEIDQLRKGFLKRFGGIVSSPVSTQRIIGAGMGDGIGFEKSGDSVRHRRPVRQLLVKAGEDNREAPDRLLFH